MGQKRQNWGYRITLMLATSLITTQGLALDFRTPPLGPNRLEGLVDLELAYGIRWRMQDRDPKLISLGNGGTGPNSNIDDGNLNYDKGDPVSNMLRATGELTLQWGSLGAYLRGYAFYDYENEERSRARTPLSSVAEDQVGSDIELQEAYLSTRFDVSGMPLQFRLGDQVVNWGESRFFPADGVNVINPLNVPLAQQPTSQPGDLRRPVGMLWGSLQPTPIFAIEGYYQYDWDKTVLPATGTFLSADDIVSPGGRIVQTGPFNNLGTNVDAVYGLPPGTVGFVPNWFQIPRSTQSDRPSNQGQFGLNAQWLIPQMNDTKITLQFANYHSKVPLVALINPPLENYLAYTRKAIAAQAANLIRQGAAPANAAAAAFSTQLNQFLNATRYTTEYPENIPMLGLSVNTTLLTTGTALFGEISQHFDVPMQVALNQVFNQLLPNSTPTSAGAIVAPVDLSTISPAELAANFANKQGNYIKELDKTFLAVGATQLFGPRFGASQTALTTEIGWLHIWDFPSKNELLMAGPGLVITEITPKSAFADADSWGYRLAGNLTYNNVFGAVTLSPRVVFTHDVDGVSPPGVGPFREGNKTFTVGLGGEYIQSVRADISYTTLWGDDRWNLLNDRDYLNFSIRYSF
jgi:hypothetical protein